MTHYVAYLDEFGHVGQYIDNDNPRDLPAYQWEKKGSKLFTTRNITKYRALRQATFRMLNRINKVGGHVIYGGEHKACLPPPHNPTATFKRQLLQAVRTIDRFCAKTDSTFMLLLDEQRAGNEWRERNVEACTLAMFEDSAEKCRSLIEPPLQGESHLFQTLQCADWLCGLIGRLMALAVSPEEYPDWEPFDRYFSTRIAHVALPGSGLQGQPVVPPLVEAATAELQA